MRIYISVLLKETVAVCEWRGLWTEPTVDGSKSTAAHSKCHFQSVSARRCSGAAGSVLRTDLDGCRGNSPGKGGGFSEAGGDLIFYENWDLMQIKVRFALDHGWMPWWKQLHKSDVLISTALWRQFGGKTLLFHNRFAFLCASEHQLCVVCAALLWKLLFSLSETSALHSADDQTLAITDRTGLMSNRSSFFWRVEKDRCKGLHLRGARCLRLLSSSPANCLLLSRPPWAFPLSLCVSD